MTEMYRVVARIISQQGTCTAGHRVGDEFIIDDTTPNGMCSWAFYTVFPFASTLQYKGSFPWENNSEKAVVACPDPTNPVVFELRRVKK
jgi:uncharacterized repeat protein (TIGR04076 family)